MTQELESPQRKRVRNQGGVSDYLLALPVLKRKRVHTPNGLAAQPVVEGDVESEGRVVRHVVGHRGKTTGVERGPARLSMKRFIQLIIVVPNPPDLSSMSMRNMCNGCLIPAFMCRR